MLSNILQGTEQPRTTETGSQGAKAEKRWPHKIHSIQEIHSIAIHVCTRVGALLPFRNLLKVHTTVLITPARYSILYGELMAFSNGSVFQKCRSSRGETHMWTNLML